MLLALASKKEIKQQLIILHVLNITLSEFLPYCVHSSCWMQDAKSGQNIRLSKVCLIREHHWIVFSSRIFRLESSSIYFFYFPYLFINIFSFSNPKNHFSTLDQGFPISERSLEALVRFISSPHTFSSFHRSFLLSKSKHTKKISYDFNLLTFLPVNSTSTCHWSNLKIKFLRVKYKFV